MTDPQRMVLEFEVRVLDVEHDRSPRVGSENLSEAMLEIADAVRPIVEKHGLTYNSMGYGGRQDR